MTRRNGYYLAGGALAACVLAALAGFDGGVGSDAGRRSGVPGASLADGGLSTSDVDGHPPLRAARQATRQAIRCGPPLSMPFPLRPSCQAGRT